MHETILAIHAIPKSSCNKVEGYETDAKGERWLRVRITAAPEDGKANKALIAFLAKEWKIPKSALSLVSGETSRYKRFKVAKGTHVPADYHDRGAK